MNLFMPVRIKARDDFTARFALSLVGGKYRDGVYPKFEFVSQEHKGITSLSCGSWKAKRMTTAATVVIQTLKQILLRTQ